MRVADRPKPLSVVLVGPADSVHLTRWADGLTARGNHVTIVDLFARRRGFVSRLAYLRDLRLRVSRAARAPHAIVNLHYVPAGWLALGLRGLHPTVASVWGGDVETGPTGVRGSWRDRQLGALLAACEARTATSGFLRDVVRKRFALDATVVPFGVDTTLFVPGHAERRGRTRIGFVKWLDATYGPDVLLSAFARVTGGADVELVIVGDGPMETDLRVQAARLGVTDRVTFLGRRPHDTLPDVLRSIDVFAMPSRRESFGLSALEASACGVPVVASDIGGVPEVVRHGETGLLVPAGDVDALAVALRQLVQDAQRRRAMGAAGRRFVTERFEWSRCLGAMEQVYRGVLASSSGSRRTTH